METTIDTPIVDCSEFSSQPTYKYGAQYWQGYDEGRADAQNPRLSDHVENCFFEGTPYYAGWFDGHCDVVEDNAFLLTSPPLSTTEGN